LVRRLERSWIGLNLDALRLDEIAASCFGLDIARWKITAFLLGNFLIGIAGALFGMVGGFVAPNNYTFADSLIMVSILLLGGIGNPWGLVVATSSSWLCRRSCRTIQEYRILLFALIVIMMLLFRPEGLLPRPVRRYSLGGGHDLFVEARGLTRKLAAWVALDNLDLAVVPNEIIGLIGPNGSGKDDVLQCRHRNLRRPRRLCHFRWRGHYTRLVARVYHGRHFPAPFSARGCRRRCRSSTTS